MKSEIFSWFMADGCEVIIDYEDADRVGANWTCYHRKRPGKRETIYVCRPGNITKTLHRFILNVPPRQIVDHKNGNGLDNRKQNLRPATKGEVRQSDRLTTAHVGW